MRGAGGEPGVHTPKVLVITPQNRVFLSNSLRPLSGLEGSQAENWLTGNSSQQKTDLVAGKDGDQVIA